MSNNNNQWTYVTYKKTKPKPNPYKLTNYTYYTYYTYLSPFSLFIKKSGIPYWDTLFYLFKLQFFIYDVSICEPKDQ